MRRPDLKSSYRYLIIGVVVVAVGFFLLRAYRGSPGDIVIVQYSAAGQPLNRDNAVRVRLDADRLRAHGLSRDDVLKALAPSGLVDPDEPPPQPGVIFLNHVPKLNWCENIVLKANAEGEIVRLKDVATVKSAR